MRLEKIYIKMHPTKNPIFCLSTVPFQNFHSRNSYSHQNASFKHEKKCMSFSGFKTFLIKTDKSLLLYNWSFDSVIKCFNCGLKRWQSLLVLLLMECRSKPRQMFLPPFGGLQMCRTDIKK